MKKTTKKIVSKSNWGVKSTENRISASKAGAATKGSGLSQSNSGWRNAEAKGDGTEGSITNASRKGNLNAKSKSWAD